MSCTITSPVELTPRLFSLKVQDIPLVSSKVPAGFPSPADDHLDNSLNLSEWLVKHEAATFFVRASGQSMQGVGILDNDLLIVDRSITPVNGSVVIAVVNGEHTVKILRHEKKNSWLQPANPDYPAIPLTEETNAEIWGVVTGVARQHGSNGRVCTN